VTATRRWRPAWVLVSALGALLAYRTAWDSMPPCDCFEWRYLAMMADLVVVPFSVAGLLVIAGIAGSLGLLDGVLRSARSLAADAAHIARHRLSWPILATAIGLPAALIMLSGRPNPVGLVPLAGVLAIWAGILTRNAKVVSVGVLVAVGSGALILLWLLLLLVAWSQVRI
jgi:hypothetical protein